MSHFISGQQNKFKSEVDDEIRPKDVILKIQKWWEILRFRGAIIVILSLFVGLSAALNSKFFKKPSYTASYQLFFQQKSSGLSGAMRLASSFGIGVIGGASASSSSTVQEYLTSRSNITHVMMADIKNGRLIDRYYARSFDDDDEFKEEFRINFQYNQRYTDSILTHVCKFLNDAVLGTKFDEEIGVLNVYATFGNEEFTFDLLRELIRNTENQFISWKREKGQDAINAFQNKVDSLETEIDLTLRKLGENSDQNNSLVSSLDKMKETRLMIDMEALKVAYGEYIRGLEMSKAEVIQLEPPFKYFDSPVLPLQKEKPSTLKAGIRGSVVTGFLLVLFFIGREEARNIMAD